MSTNTAGTKEFPLSTTIESAKSLAQEFDRHRHCGWNSSNVPSDYNSPDFDASNIPEFASLGNQCSGTIQELALLHTLRPCKACGGDILYKSNYQISCCSCFGDQDDCEDCKQGGCRSFAENMNLTDAITRWNLHFGDTGERGRVQVIG
jgi:hypothetical protein